MKSESTALMIEPRSGAALSHVDEIASLSAEILERYEEATMVYRLCESLGAVLGERPIAERVLAEAVERMSARRGAVWLAQGDELVLAVSSPSGEPASWHPEQAGAIPALSAGRAWIRDPQPGGEPIVAVALPGADDSILGVLALCGRLDGRPYRSGETKLLTALAALTSAFILNDRMSVAYRHAEARKREDEIARQVHRNLLPSYDVAFDGLDLSGASIAADNIGGDYYGYIPMPDGSLGVAMADVSGHGVGAALYMAAMKGALQAEARRALSPHDLLTRTNDALVADFAEGEVFATAFMARFYPGSRKLDFASAGHHAPLLMRADGRLDRLEAAGGALGLVREMTFEEGTRSLEEGDVLVLFTDGLVEARDAQGRFYGVGRLVETVRRHRALDAGALSQAILDDFVRHCNGSSPNDDVTLVVARCVECDEIFAEGEL